MRNTENLFKQNFILENTNNISENIVKEPSSAFSFRVR